MIQLTYADINYTAYVTTEDKRINTSVPVANIGLLFKFTNDLSGAVKYAYSNSTSINDRYSQVRFTHNTTEDVFTGDIDLKPFGYWKYEVYEVSYTGTVPVLTKDNSPSNENDTADIQSGIYGTVQGLVEVGKMYVSETVGQEQVKYTEYTETQGNNYIYL